MDAVSLTLTRRQLPLRPGVPISYFPARTLQRAALFEEAGNVQSLEKI